MPHVVRFVLAALLVVAVPVVRAASTDSPPDAISLSGDWAVRPDPRAEGLNARWFMRTLDGAFVLPGTLPRHDAVWFQREIDIPESWRGRRVTLHLERARPSTVWVDDSEIESFDSLAAPHVYDLTADAKPGRHRLTLRVDAGKFPLAGLASAPDWNGVLGRLELHVTDPAWMEGIQLDPAPSTNRIRVTVRFGSINRAPIAGTLTLQTDSAPGSGRLIAPRTTQVAVPDGPPDQIEMEINLDPDAPRWEIGAPALHRLTIHFSGLRAGLPVADRRELLFGLRETFATDTVITVNGRPLAYASAETTLPTAAMLALDEDAWRERLSSAAQRGVLLHRFPGWCPPSAAFAAADTLGVALAPGLDLPPLAAAPPPPTSDVRHDARSRYLLAEGERILRHFGHHASFIALEIGGNAVADPRLADHLVSVLRALDGARRSIVRSPTSTP